ncbi:hypothetical protein [Timonella senegalensis]|uniref:hypothetical protein n=1 Tax=Timonella senegalensis TaxID=1465825 RepID=UPI002FDE8994
MSSTELVPSTVRFAAKRGFIRTAAQSLASVIPTTGVVVGLTGDWFVAAGLGTASAVVTAGLAGAASYFSILSNGIPEAYHVPAPSADDEKDPDDTTMLYAEDVDAE